MADVHILGHMDSDDYNNSDSFLDEGAASCPVGFVCHIYMCYGLFVRSVF